MSTVKERSSMATRRRKKKRSAPDGVAVTTVQRAPPAAASVAAAAAATTTTTTTITPDTADQGVPADTKRRRSKKGKKKKAASAAGGTTAGASKAPLAAPGASALGTFPKHTLYAPSAVDANMPAAQWWQLAPALDDVSQHHFVTSADGPGMHELRLYCNDLLEQQAELIKQQTSTGGKGGVDDDRWIRAVMKSGTLMDRVVAQTVMLQTQPLAHLTALRSLHAMAAKNNVREAKLALDALRDLFVQNLLPKRRLRFLSQCPVLHPDVQPVHLLVWYFEDVVKSFYSEFVAALEAGAKNALRHFRDSCVKTMFDAVMDVPEQEEVLLQLLVNKLGDMDRKIASKVAHLLLCLVERHPNMRLVVIDEVEQFLLRSQVGDRARYYGVVFLNQILLDGEHPEVAIKLLEVYLTLFKMQMSNSSVPVSKLMSGLLTGVNRAYPYVPGDVPILDQHLDALFQVVFKSSFNKRCQALLLIFQVMSSRGHVEDKFYRALYAAMLHPNLYESSRQAMFLNVVYKAMKADTMVGRVCAFAKRLVQVATYQKPAFICGALIVLSEVLKLHPDVKALLHQTGRLAYEEVRDSALVKSEPGQAASPKATIKQEESRVLIAAPKVKVAADADAPKADADATSKALAKERASALQHLEQLFGTDDLEDEVVDAGVVNVEPSAPSVAAYNPVKRDPLRANAASSCFWELVPLTGHFHPSVVAFANRILSGEHIAYSSDPLQDFTLSSFLDRFSYKNPKQRPSSGGRQALRARALALADVLPPVNTEAFLEQDEADVREEDAFFYHYFQAKKERERVADAKAKQRQHRKEVKQKRRKLEQEAGDVSYDYDDLDDSNLASDGVSDDDEVLFDADAFDDMTSADLSFDEDGDGMPKGFVDADEFAQLLEEKGGDWDREDDGDEVDVHHAKRYQPTQEGGKPWRGKKKKQQHKKKKHGSKTGRKRGR